MAVGPQLLHVAACREVTAVDREEAGIVEQFVDRGFGGGVVAGQEDHPSAGGLVGICAQDVRPERVGGLDEPGAGDEVGDDLAGGAPSSAFHAFVASITV